MHQLTHRFAFDLANPLAGHVELFAQLLERVVRRRVDSEAHPQDLRFARRQRVERFVDRGPHVRVNSRVRGRCRARIFDHVAERRVGIFANRRLERNRLPGDLQDGIVRP